MPRKILTETEIRILKKNPYTYKVTDKTIQFTVAFQEEFWRRYQCGEAPTQIIKELGYEKEILGEHRIEGISSHIKEVGTAGMEFYQGHSRPKRRKTVEYDEPSPTPKTLAFMQNELIYLHQEVEFIKKIMQADSAQRRNK